MKNENLESRSWDDLVFENRNHEYGAYVIRKSYSDNLLSGTCVSIMLAALVLIAPLLFGFRGKDVPPSSNGKDTLVTIPVPLIELIPPPIIPTSVKPPVVANSVLPPRVVVEEVDDDIPTNVDVAASMPDTDDGDGGVGTDIGTGPVAPPPVIEEPTEFIVVEVMPQYEGGMAALYQFVQRKLKYPAVPRRMEIEGTVFVSFLVDANGNVADVKIIKGAHADLDKEAARVIAMLPAWKPGKQHNKNVAVRMSLPIKFKLDH